MGKLQRKKNENFIDNSKGFLVRRPSFGSDRFHFFLNDLAVTKMTTQHMNKEKYYISDDLTFVASGILLNRFSIKKVENHPQKVGMKIFFLAPKDEAQEFYRKYISDAIKISPQRLNSKIAAIRHMPAEEET